nr:hypothetical protein [Tanacetum cinerariifolium]
MEEEEIVAKDEAKIIYPYDEEDPNNRPPPALNDESKFAPSIIPVFDVENRPVPPVIHFSSTYEWCESSSAREILKDIGEVYLFSPVPLTISTAMKRIRRLNEKMHERAKVDERIMKKIDRSDLRIRMVVRDAMSLDSAVRECQGDVSKVISMMQSMSLEFDQVYKESHQTLELVEWEAGAGNATMANDDVEDDDVKDDDAMDDNAADLIDPYYNYTNGMITYSLLFLCRDRIMPPKKMSQAAIAKLVVNEVAKALAADRATRNTMGAGGSRNVRGVSNTGGPERAQPTKDCTFSRFMKCGPTQFHGKVGAIELCRWFKMIECTFEISECAERNKVMFTTATLQEEFCLEEEISRMEDELRHLSQYIKGLPSYIKVETYASKPTTLNEAVRMSHGLMEHKIQCGDPNHLANSDLCPERKKQGGRNASGHVYAVKDAEQAQGPNVVIDENLVIPLKEIQLDDKLHFIKEPMEIMNQEFANEEGVDCLLNSTIFEQLASRSPKTTAWNEFSSTVASTIICLATNQKFNFSKWIFDSMDRNLDNLSGKFLMYPRFIQVFLDKQIDGLSNHERKYVLSSHTKKFFGNMRRIRKGFSGRITLLFPTMVVQLPLGTGLETPTNFHHTPTILQSSSSQPQKTRKPRIPARKVTEVPQPSDPMEHVVDEVIHKELGGSLVKAAITTSSLETEQDSVIELEKTKTTQANEIDSLKRRVKKLEKRNKSITHKLKRLYKVGLTTRVESSDNEESLSEDASKQGRRIDVINADKDITLVNVQDDAEMFDVDDLGGEEVFVVE